MRACRHHPSFLGSPSGIRRCRLGRLPRVGQPGIVLLLQNPRNRARQWLRGPSSVTLTRAAVSDNPCLPRQPRWLRGQGSVSRVPELVPQIPQPRGILGCPPQKFHTTTRGQGRLRDARSDSANHDGLPAVVGARQVAGDRHASTAESSRRLGDAGRRCCPETDFAAMGDTDKLPARGLRQRCLRRHGPHRGQPARPARRLPAKPAMGPSVVVAQMLAQDAFGVKIDELAKHGQKP
jgi:hypothetical protein